jgi:hypothetical protein
MKKRVRSLREMAMKMMTKPQSIVASAPWLAFSVMASGLFVGSCSPSTNVIQRTPGGDNLAQGPGTEPGDDLDVALPIPMALIGGDDLAEAARGLKNSGAGGSYDQIESVINPMDTNEDAGGIPKNFAISFNIMSIPGYAAGELMTLLYSMVTLSDDVFGSDGYFRGEDIVVNRTITHFKISDGSDRSKPEYAEVVVVDAIQKLFRVNLYTRVGTDRWELTTSLEFQRKVPETDAVGDFAIVKLSHTILPINSLYREFLELNYDSELKEFAATFGRAPEVLGLMLSNPNAPSATKVRLKIDNDKNLFVVQGAYTWKLAETVRPTTTPRPPTYYKPVKEDIALFDSVTATGSNAETVQRLVFAPVQSDGSPSIQQANATTWQLANNGYTKEVLRYLTELVRTKTITPDCVHITDIVRNAVQANTTLYNRLDGIPDDLCYDSTQGALDAHVDTVLEVGCLHTDILLDLNVLVSGQSSSTPMRVNLCAKYIEGYLLRNNQYIKVDLMSNGQMQREPVVIYDTNQSLLAQLLNWTAPNTIYQGLQTELLSLPSMDLRDLSGRQWDPVNYVDYAVEDQNHYFSTAKDLTTP